LPEGDTIFLVARALHRALAGRIVTRFESMLPALNRIDDDAPIAGRTIESVGARGKHLLMTFSGDLVLHTHLRMNGSWHIYRTGERWRRSRRDMRIVVATDAFEAVGFNVPIAEFLGPRQLARHQELRLLGPDLLDAAFDGVETARRMRGRGADAIGDVLLNQHVVAGIGNVLKSEILFVAGIDPFAKAGDLSDTDLDRLISVARQLISANIQDRPQIRQAFGRRTTGSLDPNAKLWVYGRGGQPCRRCGTAIQMRKTGLDARVSYWCPSCQRS
jgi:endonuclease-8